MPGRPSPELRTLSAACDVAVLRALELVGKRVARENRSRFGTMQRSGKAWHEVHTVWAPEEAHVDAALAGAWSLVPRLLTEHGCCSVTDPDLSRALDEYVRELVAAQRPHSFAALEEKLRDVAG